MTSKNQRLDGFSLLEILVATALLSFISIFLFSTLNTLTNTVSSEQHRSRSFQDARTVVDQMGRELQQTITGFFGPTNAYHDVFHAISTGNFGDPSELHFLAVLDNSAGHEEVEVHYRFDGTNTLYKSLVLAKWPNGSVDVKNWDFNTNRDWKDTPKPDDLTMYSPVLEGVRSMELKFWRVPYGPQNDDALIRTSWPDTHPWCQTNFAPSFADIVIKAYDQSLIKKFGTALDVPVTMTNNLRNFHFIVQIPRSEEPLPDDWQNINGGYVDKDNVVHNPLPP